MEKQTEKLVLMRSMSCTQEGYPMYDNYHFGIMPKFTDQKESDLRFMELLGHKVVEVPVEQAERLRKQMAESLSMQLEINQLWNEDEKKKK